VFTYVDILRCFVTLFSC